MKVLLLLAFVGAIVATEYSVISNDGKWVVVDGLRKDAAAVAEFTDSREADGWTRLRVEMLDETTFSLQEQFIAAGYLEGYITSALITDAYYNFANGTGLPLSQKMQDLVSAQLSFIKDNVARKTEDEYWTRLGLAVAQYEGIINGYNAAASSENQLSYMQMMAYALQFEIGDIAQATSEENLVHFSAFGQRSAAKPHPVFQTNQGRRMLEGEHCSVLIKPSPDGQELLAGHVTWSSMNVMLRVYKKYIFKTGSLSFSSFPGLPYSGDDWHINGHQLLITETTNEIFNTSLYQFMTKETVPYWLRVQVANDAQTAPDWHLAFQQYNNGGYNNQWMIIDYKLFTPGSPLVSDTFVVGEQIPGQYHFADQSGYLNDNGYWGSYNVPFYKEIYDRAGYVAAVEKFGNEFSHEHCARANIYRRDQHNVHDLATLKIQQRYNKWQHDPFSLDDACRGISARCDLNSPVQNHTMNGLSAFGAVDGKVTSSALVGDLVSEAVCGPSWDSQPIFWWSDTWSAVPCRGCPRIYNFHWVEMDF